MINLKTTEYYHLNKEEMNFPAIIVMKRETNKWGIIDTEGNEILPCKFDMIFNFSQDLAVVELNDKYGFVNKKGNFIIPIKYESVTDFLKEGIAGVCLNGLWGFINKKEKIVIPYKYESIGNFCVGAGEQSKRILSVKLNDKYGFIDLKDNVKIPFKYDSVDTYRNDKIIMAEFKGKWGLIDNEDNILVPFEYDNIHISRDRFVGFDNEDGSAYFVDINDFSIHKFTNSIEDETPFILYYAKYKDDYILSFRWYIGFINEFKKYIKKYLSPEIYNTYMELIEKLEKE